MNFKEIYYKSILKEEIAWQQSLSTMLWDIPRGKLQYAKLPLSTPILNRIFSKPPRTTVFHVTEWSGVSKLIKIEGTKKSISTLANTERTVIESGIRAGGGVVVELEGDVLMAAADDVMSQPDKTGRRWIELETIKNLKAPSLYTKIKKDVENMLWGIIKTHAEYPELDWAVDKAWAELKVERARDGKIMSLIIKDYLDGMEKVMKRHSKGLKKVFYDYLKKRDKDGTNRRWDEIVVNNIKIKMIHTAEYGDDDFEDMGIPVKKYGWEDGVAVDMRAGNEEIAAYVAKKSQQLARKK